MKRALVTLLFVTSVTALAGAQPRPRAPKTPAPTGTALTNLRAHVGSEQVTRLLHGDADERLRGIERAAAIGTPEAIALLADAVEHDRAQQLRADPRALLAIARALARFADQERARAALLAVINAGNPGITGRLPLTGRGETTEIDPILQTELARETAAIALARSGGDKATESLYTLARNGGSGQTAAMLALSIHPPRETGFFGTSSLAAPPSGDKGAVLSPAVVKLLGDLGDLRALDLLHRAARSPDVPTRCAALVALAELGDERARLLARAAIAESDIRLRAASGEVFILLAAPERFKATAAIIADDATTIIGLKMAELVFDPEITKLVAARTIAPDRQLRAAAIRALGRSPDPNAAKALTDAKLLGDRESAYLALFALARSPAPNAGPLVVGLLANKAVATLAARSYVVRAFVRGERSDDRAVYRLADSTTPTERAVGVFARVALGADGVGEHLGDKDVRVRRAAAMGALARPGDALLRHWIHETDAATRGVLAAGLIDGDPDARIETSTLLERAQAGQGDAALATYALARRADAGMAREVGQLLAAGDPLLRAHAARGLAAASIPDATGRLADAYAIEAEVEVRRALVGALAARVEDVGAPQRRNALASAATVDPDAVVRQLATRIPHAIPPLRNASSAVDAAWLRVTLADGSAPGSAEPFVGSVVGSDGIAVPILFDDEGFAVALGLPPGGARLVLAPRLPADEARVP